MERIQALIDKLVSQQRENQPSSQLLITVQMLQAELTRNLAQNPVSNSRSRVAVTFPNAVHVHATTPDLVEPKAEVKTAVAVVEPQAEVVTPPPVPEEKPVFVEEVKIPQPKPVEIPVKDQPYIPRIPTPSEPDKPYTLRKPVWVREEESKPVAQTSLFQPEVKVEPVSRATIQPREDVAPVFKDIKPAAPVVQNPALTQLEPETPVLAQHEQPKELHEAFSKPAASLNDRLKQSKTELVSTLQDSPIKDLRKGVGINDRFSFVNELFRGDEAMYERSIKTINGFHILAEAEYWINRELKFKLGWNDTTETVQRFYGLVRRRFA